MRSNSEPILAKEGRSAHPLKAFLHPATAAAKHFFTLAVSKPRPSYLTKVIIKFVFAQCDVTLCCESHASRNGGIGGCRHGVKKHMPTAVAVCRKALVSTG